MEGWGKGGMHHNQPDLESPLRTYGEKEDGRGGCEAGKRKRLNGWCKHAACIGGRHSSWARRGGTVGLRLEAAGGRAGQLESNNGRGTGYEERTITKDEPRPQQPGGPSAGLPSPGVASPGWTGTPGRRGSFSQQRDKLPASPSGPGAGLGNPSTLIPLRTVRRMGGPRGARTGGGTPPTGRMYPVGHSAPLEAPQSICVSSQGLLSRWQGPDVPRVSSQESVLVISRAIST